MTRSYIIFLFFLFHTKQVNAQTEVGVSFGVAHESIYDLSSDDRYFAEYEIDSPMLIGGQFFFERANKGEFIASIQFNKFNVSYDVESLKLNSSFANRSSHKATRIRLGADWTWKVNNSERIELLLGVGIGANFTLVNDSEGEGYYFKLIEQVTANGDTILAPGAVTWNSEDRNSKAIGAIYLSSRVACLIKYQISNKIGFQFSVRPELGLTPFILEDSFPFNSVSGLYYSTGLNYRLSK